MAEALATTAPPEAVDMESPPLQPVYVWELPVRLTHWLIFLSITLLAISGIYIGTPFIQVSGPAGEHFVMGTMKAIHYYAAIFFTLSVLARIAWMFVGNRWARWHQFVPLRKRRRERLLPTIKFYLFARDAPPLTVGHNPLAGATYSLIFLLFLVMIATGLGIYGLSAHVESPMRHFAFLVQPFGGAQSARFIHHVAMWLILGFVPHHIASAVLVSRVERNGILDSIFSGFKFLPPSAVAESVQADETEGR